MHKILLIFSTPIIFFLYSCGGGSVGGSDLEGPIYNTEGIVGEWSFSPNCEEYSLGTDTIYLANELPDTISIFSNSDNILSIDAGANTLSASIDINGDFVIEYQSFRAYLDLGIISDTATIYLTGNGNFSSDSLATMDLTFSEPNLPGQIDCTVSLSKLN